MIFNMPNIEGKIYGTYSGGRDMTIGIFDHLDLSFDGY